MKRFSFFAVEKLHPSPQGRGSALLPDLPTSPPAPPPKGGEEEKKRRRKRRVESIKNFQLSTFNFQLTN
jgi:hypothetical protein